MTDAAPGAVELLRPGGSVIDAPALARLDEALARLDSGELSGLVLVTGDTQAQARAYAPGPDPTGFLESCTRISTARAPVVAVLAGVVQGQGAALALSACARVAAGDAVFFWPEPEAALLPPAGSVVRLARLAGAAAALDLVGRARPVGVQAARSQGILDAVAGDEGEALVLARRIVAAGPPARHAPDSAAAMAAVQAARARLGRGEGMPLAPARLVDCVEAAFLLPAPAALAFAQEAGAEVAADPVGAALRYLAAAERALSPGLVQRDANGGLVLSQAGMEAAGAMRAAWVIAARALVAGGADPVAVDSAALAFGHSEGPLGTAPEPRPDPVLADRLLAASLAEAARLVDEGRVASAAEADTLAVMATGFPRWRGGPVLATIRAGQGLFARRMADWAEEDPVWTLPEMVGREILLSGRWGEVS